MSLNLIFGRKYAQSSIGGPLVGTLAFDTMISEEHSYSSRVTYFPIESGTIVSDHIINNPDTVTLSGLVTDTPLNIFAPFNRSIAAFNFLIQLHQRREVVTVVTGIKVYQNMAITSLNVPRTIKTGQSLIFNIELQRIRFINNIQAPLSQGNVFGGVQDNSPRDIIAENSTYPLIQNDPQYSLKDQACSAVNLGVQSLIPIQNGILPNVLTNLSQILVL